MSALLLLQLATIVLLWFSFWAPAASANAMSQTDNSQDEFADLPDIVDFGAIPLINLTNPPSDNTRANPADEFMEYDDYNDVDCFTGINLDTIAELGPVQPPFQAVGGVEAGLPQSEPQPNEDVRTQSAASASSQYEYEELEPSIWDVVDVIEQNAMEQDGSVIAL